MADVLLTADKTDNTTENAEITSENLESGMTQKQEEGETDSFASGEVELNTNADDALPPLIRLEKYAGSDIIFNRQIVARNLLETFRDVVDNAEEVTRVVNVLCGLADDFEPSVRIELMQQIPSIVQFFTKYEYQYGQFITQYIAPLIIKYLTDINNQVRKTCQSSLLMIIEKNLITVDMLVNKICPCILQLTEPSYMDDLRTESIALLSKVSPLVGKDVTIKLFLERFLMLCLDPSFHVRKVCAENFGEVCAIVEKEMTEKQLLPKFFLLCEDSIWGVRKVCAEVFMSVSYVCSMDTRHKELAAVYMNLLIDPSKWVRMAAFQALGPFISTFAEPSRTGMYYNTEYDFFVETEVSEPEKDSEISFPQKVEEKEAPPSETSVPPVSCDSVIPSTVEGNSTNDCCVPNSKCCVGNFCPVIESSSLSDCESSSMDCLKSKYTDCDRSVTDISNDRDSPVCEGDNICHNYPQENCEEQSTDHSEKLVDVNSTGQSSEQEGVILNEELCNGELSTEEFFEWSSSIKEEHSNPDHLKVVLCRSNHRMANGYIDPILRQLTDSFQGFDIDENVVDECLLDNMSSLRIQELDENDSEEISGCPDQEWGWYSVPARDHETLPLSHISNSSLLPDVEQGLNSLMTTLEPAFESDVADSSTTSESAFNHFQFWRMPLLSIDTSVMSSIIEPPEELNSIDHCDNNRRICLISRDYVSSHGSNYSSAEMNCHAQTSVCQTCFQKRDSSTTESVPNVNSTVSEDSLSAVKFSKFLPSSEESTELSNSDLAKDSLLASAFKQDIIPPELLFNYLCMTDYSGAQNIDAEIARHCAYSLPAVALTLGKKNWSCLKETYNTLASGMQGFIMQWKVRRTLASSLHQLALILGPDIAATDLLPVFSGFIKDLDEVRIGILQNLSAFLQVLRVKERREYLPQLTEFLNADSERNWRFRFILAEQLILVAKLYEPSDVREYLVPLTLTLIEDKVAEVRRVAVRVMAVLVGQMKEDRKMTKDVLAELAERFTHASKWLYRQIYVYLCQEFVKEESLPADQFAEDVLPHLLYLCWDRVANVRLAIARCMAVVIWPSEIFSDADSPHRDLLLQALHPLQSDMDADVRYFANMVSTHECSCQQHDALTELDDQAV